MTATAISTTQAVSEWVKIFPKQVTETYSSSVTFMKQLTVVAVSTIAYLKNALPEDSYTQETFGGVKLRILKKKCRNELAQFLSTALTQAFEAFDRRFLHTLALCFYDEECKPENLIEYHIFEYSYNEDKVTMNVHSKSRDSESTKYTFENVRERTVHLIRACVVMMQMSQSELSSSYDVSIRLYYNQDAPADYQAPGYLSAEESHDHLEPYLSDTVKLGWVDTPYHKLAARSFFKEHMTASHDAIPSQNRPVLSNEMQPSGSNVRSQSEVQIVCPCNKYGGDSYDVTGLLKCIYCATYQHAICFGVPSDVTASYDVTQHCCAACHDREPNRTPTDKKLVSLTNEKRESLCIFRHTLEWCSQIPTIDGASIANRFRLSEGNANKLMRLLQSHGIVAEGPTDATKAPQKIILGALKSAMSKFFNTNEVLVDRLMAETLLEASDPLEVISPMERVSLTREGAGSITPPRTTAPNEQTHDTMVQYKEAFNDDNLKLDVKCNKRKLDSRNLRKGVRTKKARM